MKENNSKEIKKVENKAEESATVQGKGRKIAIISLICASVVLVVAAICVGAFAGSKDVPNKGSSSSEYYNDDDWTNNY